MCSALVSRSVLRALNVVLLLFGILVVALGAASIQFANEFFSESSSDSGNDAMVLDTHFVSYAMIAGGVLMLMAFVGIVGSIHGTEKDEHRGTVKVVLYFYAIVLLVFILLQIIGGGFAYQYADGVQRTAKLNKIDPDSLSDKDAFYLHLTDTEEKVDKFIRKQYKDCCTDPVTAQTSSCNAIRYGLNLKAGFENNQYNACGVNQQEFYDQVVKLFSDNFYRVAGAMLVIGLLEVTMVISALHLACQNFQDSSSGSSAKVVQRELSSV